MARLPRLFLEGVPDHVILRGNNRQDIFVGDGDRVFFHRCLVEIARESDVAVHAYVFMTNHVHLLATGARRESLSRLAQRLGRRYVQYFNYLHGRTGTLWEGRFKSTPVQVERYFFACQRYIELNPVRAGMVDHPVNHRWSSYGVFANGTKDDLVTPHELVLQLADDDEGRRRAYRRLFDDDLDEATLRKIRHSIQKGWVLGTDEYCEQIAPLAYRPPRPRRKGRPKKRGELEKMESDPIYSRAA